MTPSDIEFLIHCHVSPRKFERFDAPAVQNALRVFLANNMVVRQEAGIYGTTARGAAHIEQLCNVPLPVVTFIGFDGKQIKI